MPAGVVLVGSGCNLTLGSGGCVEGVHCAGRDQPDGDRGRQRGLDLLHHARPAHPGWAAKPAETPRQLII